MARGNPPENYMELLLHRHIAKFKYLDIARCRVHFSGCPGRKTSVGMHNEQPFEFGALFNSDFFAVELKIVLLMNRFCPRNEIYLKLRLPI